MQLLETIYLKDGQWQNIDYHNQRFNDTRKAVFGKHKTLNLTDLVEIPNEYKKGEFRCRVIYEGEIESVSFVKYTQKQIKKLKLIDISEWNYEYKYADRGFLNNLLAENPDVDEVIMTKNGFVTDCTIANLAFYDGKNWFTPSTPLLKGTKRQQLLEKQMIMEREIRVPDISQYEGVCLINCFRNLELENLVYLNKQHGKFQNRKP
jgi:4-amino-4-deoxychorismate lyase